MASTVYEFKYKPSGTTGNKESFLLGTSVGGSLNFYLYNNFDYADTNLSFKGKNVTWDSYTQLSLKSEKDEKKASIEIKGPESSITISADTTTISTGVTTAIGTDSLAISADNATISADSIIFSVNTTTIDGNIISATTPTENTHLTNKEYVDTKVPIDSGIMELTDIIGSESLPTGVKKWNEYDTFVYAYSPKAEKTKGQEDLRFPEGPKWIRLSQEWNPQHEDSSGSLTAVQRTSAGTITAADPISSHDVATKGYVDTNKRLYYFYLTNVSNSTHDEGSTWSIQCSPIIGPDINISYDEKPKIIELFKKHAYITLVASGIYSYKGTDRYLVLSVCPKEDDLVVEFVDKEYELYDTRIPWKDIDFGISKTPN